MKVMMQTKHLVRVVLLTGFVSLAACSSDPELTNDDPANCEQMKDMPEMYDECMSKMAE